MDDSLSYQRAADLVIAMAGYNTTAEILSLGARALLVPRRGPSAEQQMRARRFAERGWVYWLPPASLSTESLAAAVLDALDSPVGPASRPPDLLGRQRAARHLLDAGLPEGRGRADLLLDRLGRPGGRCSADLRQGLTVVLVARSRTARSGRPRADPARAARPRSGAAHLRGPPRARRG